MFNITVHYYDELSLTLKVTKGRSMREFGMHADVCLPSRCCHVEIKEIKSKTDILWLLSEAHTLALWISDFFRHETVHAPPPRKSLKSSHQ